MKRQKATKKTNDTETVRVDSVILAKVKAYKETSGVAINKFYDLAASDRLKSLGIEIDTKSHK
jgi:hypothetical protein